MNSRIKAMLETFTPEEIKTGLLEKTWVFQESSQRLQAVLDAQGFSEQDLEEVIAEFNVVRKRVRAVKK